MKKLLLITLVGLASIACEKDDNNLQPSNNNNNSNDSTNVVDTTSNDTTIVNIEGMWTSSNQESNITMSVSVGGQPLPFFNNGTSADTSYTEIVDPADFDPTAIDIQSGGTLVYYSTDSTGLTDSETGSWTKNGNIFTADVMDTVLVFNIENLTENALSFVSSIDTTISDMGLDVNVQADVIMDFTR